MYKIVVTTKNNKVINCRETWQKRREKESKLWCEIFLVPVVESINWVVLLLL